MSWDHASSRYHRDRVRRDRSDYHSGEFDTGSRPLHSDDDWRRSDRREFGGRERSPVSYADPVRSSGRLDHVWMNAPASSHSPITKAGILVQESRTESRINPYSSEDRRDAGKSRISSRDTERHMMRGTKEIDRSHNTSHTYSKQSDDHMSRDMRRTAPPPSSCSYSTLRDNGRGSSRYIERGFNESHSASHDDSRPYNEKEITPLGHEGIKAPPRIPRAKMCPVPGCDVRKRKLKEHVFRCHLPDFFRDNESREQLEDKSFHQKRANALKLLAQWILGNNQLWHLVGLINEKKGIPKESTILESSVPAMLKLCQQQGWRIPQTFKLHPANSPAVLVHWRSLVYLLNYLTDVQRNVFQRLHDYGSKETQKIPAGSVNNNLGRQVETVEMDQYESMPAESNYHLSNAIHDQHDMDITFSPDHLLPAKGIIQPVLHGRQTWEEGHVSSAQPFSLKPAGLEPLYSDIMGAEHDAIKLRRAGVSSTEDEVIVSSLHKRVRGDQPHLLPAVDSFYHLDKTALKLWGSYANATTENILWQGPKPVPGYAVNLVGGVQVFSDPDTYPEEIQAHKKWKVAIGIHPLKAHQLSDKILGKLLRLLSNKGVTALGVIGLDRSAPFDTWVQQEKAFREVLQFSKEDRPIILHVRGQSNDPYASDVHARCLKVLQEMRPSSQAVHLHCFRGKKEQVIEWLSVFPNTYFGFTPKCQEFNAHQLEALRAVPTNRILIETNSPHRWQVSGSLVTTPAMIGSVAMIVAKKGNYTCQDLLRFTTANARRLYSIKDLKE